MGIKHKCFISYHHDDQDEVEAFIEEFDEDKQIFIARAVGVMDQDVINSTDSAYIMRRIRELYLSDSTVTIVMIGKCTWARKYVDWEIASTLRNDPKNKRSGLMAITLPSMADKKKTLPPRFDDNCDGTSGYARWYKYPSKSKDLEAWIDDAFEARTSRDGLIDNTRNLFGNNRSCG